MHISKLSIKGSSPLNEDALVADFQRNVFAVIDGATSLMPYTSANGETGGYLASRLVASTIERLLSEGQAIPLHKVLLEANRMLQEEMLHAGIDVIQNEQLWSAGAVAIRISDDGIEYAQAGDCMLIAVYQDGTIRIVTHDQLAHVDRETYRLWAAGVAQGMATRDQLWEYVKPQIVKGRQSANTSGGYSVLNGDPAAVRYLEFGRINRINLRALLLMSDGVYVPKRAGETLFDAVEVTRRIQQSGLHDFVKEIIAIEESDPDCLVYPRVKKSDDKTVIWIEF